MDIQVGNLPVLHEAQQMVYGHPAQYKIVVCGRRWGKRVLGTHSAIKGIEAGHNCLWMAPTYRMYRHIWDDLRQRLDTHKAYAFSPSGSRMNCANHAVLDFCTPSTMRHEVDYKHIVIDEGALLSAQTWEFVYQYAQDHNATILLMGTPRITEEDDPDWFRRTYYQARYRKGWGGWQFGTVRNPYMSAAAVEEAKAVLSANSYGTEFDAQFVVMSKPDALDEVAKYQQLGRRGTNFRSFA